MIPTPTMRKCVAAGTMARCAPCACCTMLRLEGLAMAEQALSTVSHAGLHHDQASPALSFAVWYYIVLCWDGLV